jgi:hypothetical protein
MNSTVAPASRLTALAVLALALAPALAAAEPACGDQSEVPAAERLSNRPTWMTKSEVQSSHFDVFRSETEDGEFVKINPEPIEAANWSNELRTYSFTDDTIDPCKRYFYYVEGVSARDGYRLRVTPILEAKPKLTAPDSD